MSRASARRRCAGAPAHAARPLAALGKRRGALIRSLELGQLERRMNRPIVRLYRAGGRAVRAAARVHLALDDLRSLVAARQRAERAQRCWSSNGSTAGPILAADGTRAARAACASAEGDLRADLSDRAKSSRTRSATPSRISAGRGWSATATRRSNGEAGTNLQTILDQLQGKRRQGDEVVTTLDPAAQRAATAALGGHEGAVVALDPRTRRGEGDGLHARLRPERPALDERLRSARATTTPASSRWSTARPSSAMRRARRSRS